MTVPFKQQFWGRLLRQFHRPIWAFSGPSTPAARNEHYHIVIRCASCELQKKAPNVLNSLRRAQKRTKLHAPPRAPNISRRLTPAPPERRRTQTRAPRALGANSLPPPGAWRPTWRTRRSRPARQPSPPCRSPWRKSRRLLAANNPCASANTSTRIAPEQGRAPPRSRFQPRRAKRADH